MTTFLMFIVMHFGAYGVAVYTTRQSRKDTFFALILVELILLLVINVVELCTKFPLFTQPSLSLFFLIIAYDFWQKETRWYDSRMRKVKNFPLFYVASVVVCGYLAVMLDNFYMEVLH